MTGVISGKVLPEGMRGATALFDLPHDGIGVRRFLRSACMMDGQTRAGTRQCERNRPADFAAGTGDEGRPTGEAEGVEYVCRHDDFYSSLMLATRMTST